MVTERMTSKQKLPMGKEVNSVFTGQSKEEEEEETGSYGGSVPGGGREQVEMGIMTPERK